MAKLLSGKDIVQTLNESLAKRAQELRDNGVAPCLAIVRVGERGDDIAYETGAEKRCEKVGVAVRKFLLPQDASQDDLLRVLETVNTDDRIHGCLLFRPLPKQFDDEVVRNALLPEKDVDGITDGSLAGVYAGTKRGFPPCTPAACMEILDYYGVQTSGKCATVTVCHTKTVDMPAECRKAEILIVAAGRAGIVGKEYFSEGQTVIDVGINVDEQGNLCGDVNFGEAEPIVGAITPVPGGVGTVTTSVLVKHVIEAAERKSKK